MNATARITEIAEKVTAVVMPKSKTVKTTNATN
jgi:hypothetical protein